MSRWKIRAEGAPEYIEASSAQEIAEAVKDGLWEPSDEVKGPRDEHWVSLSLHPTFREVMDAYEPPPGKPPEDDTKLDMNPLIDVALVLLIFFMLTMTYEQLRKEYSPPQYEREGAQGTTIKENDLDKITVRVTATMDGERTVFKVENEVVEENKLEEKFKEYLAKSSKTRLALEIAPDVKWKSVVAIQGAAAGAKVTEIIRIARPAKE